MKRVSGQIKELKAENLQLKGEIYALKLKFTSLEKQNSSFIHSLLPFKFCENHFAIIVHSMLYCVPESTSSVVADRIAQDKSAVDNILMPIGEAVSSNFKLSCLVKYQSNNSRPLKLIYPSKYDAKSMLLRYNELKR